MREKGTRERVEIRGLIVPLWQGNGVIMSGIHHTFKLDKIMSLKRFYLNLLLAMTLVLLGSGMALAHSEEGRTLKWKVAIGRFSNETQYGKGIFYQRENDPLAKQAIDILSTKLVASDKFILLERSDADILAEEADSKEEVAKIPADFVLLGSITEYGRKTTGQTGLFSSEKTQEVEAGVSIRLVDTSSNVIVYSEEAKGSSATTSKSTLGIGGQAGYDATLSDKAIAAAIDQLVENMLNDLADRPWRTYIISMEDGETFISGGAAQGLREGDIFDIYEKGKKVKNPQTGAMVELPGKQVGSLRVEASFGEPPFNEISLVTILSGQLDGSDLSKYYVEERR